MDEQKKSFFQKLKEGVKNLLSKIKWTDIYNKVWPMISPIVKNKVISLVLNALKVGGGGILGWILSFVITPLLTKLGELLARKARLEDQENVNEDNISKYKEDKKNGASKEQLIKDETDLLNGNPIRRD